MPAGAPKRSAPLKDILTLSVDEWRKLPQAMFANAWIHTGLFTAEQIATARGLDVEELDKERVCHLSRGLYQNHLPNV